MLTDTNLAPAAAAELGKQIESLEPSAAYLTAKGFAWQAAAYLVTVVKSGAPDIEELRSHGIDLKTAVAICTAIAARHARKAAKMAAMKPMAPKPLPKPAAAAPTHALEKHEDVRNAARSLLHDLSLQIETERGCPTLLSRAGFSAGTAKELAKFINASRTGVW